jgi:hypothetical protein
VGIPVPMLGIYMIGSVACGVLVVAYCSRLSVARVGFSLFVTALPTILV